MDNRKACSKIKTIRKVHGAAAVANNKEKIRLPAKLSASLLSSSPPVYYDENSASSSSMITTEQVLYNSQTAFSSLSTSCCCFTSSYIITTETLLNQLLPPAAGKKTTAAAFVAGNSSSSSNKKRTKKKNTLFQNLQKNSAAVSGNQLSAKAAGACNDEDVHLYYVYTNSLCEQYKQPKKPASPLETVSSASASSSSAVLSNINKMSNKHCLRRYFTKNDTISLPSSSAAASPTSASNSKKLARTTATLPAAAAASSATASSTLKPKKKSSKQLNAAADQRKTNYNYCLLIRYLCILWLVTVIKHIDLLIRLILRISTPIISTTSNHHHHIVKPTTSHPAHASRSSPPPTTAPRSATYTKNLRKALPQIGMSSFYTMLTIICLEIILLSTMSSCAKTFYMHWNTSNSIFRIDNTDHIIDVNKGNLAFEFDQVHIICPVYEPGTYENETEKYIIYNVSKVEYETCRITNADPRVIAICDKPQKLMFFTLTFRPFTPQPGGLEFLPGNDYYFISTSSKDDLYRRIGGRCSTNNMKVVFKVCCASEDKDKTTAGGGGSAGSQPRDNTSSTSASGDTKTSSSSNNAEDINGSMGQMPTNQHVNTIGNNLDHRGAGGAVNAGSGLTPNVAGPGIIDINNPAGGMVYGNNINNNGQNPNIIGTSSINSNIDQHNPFGLRPMQHPNNGYNNGLPNGIGTSNGILFTTGHGNMNMVPTGAGGGVSMSGIPQYPGLGFHGQSGIRINNIPMNQHPNMNNINMNNNHHMHHPYDKHPNEVVKNEELTYNSGASFSAAQPFYWHWKQFAVELAASLAARLMAQYELLWNKFAVGTLLQAKQFYHSQNNNNNNLMLLIGASLAVMLMQQLLIYNLTLRRTSEAEGQAAAAATSALSSSVFIFKREETNIYIVSSNSYSNLPQQNTIPQTFIH